MWSWSPAPGEVSLAPGPLSRWQGCGVQLRAAEESSCRIERDPGGQGHWAHWGTGHADRESPAGRELPGPAAFPGEMSARLLGAPLGKSSSPLVRGHGV